MVAWLCWCVLAFAGELPMPQPGSPHVDLEELFAEGRLTEGLTRANVRLRSTPDDPDLLWMKIRFMFELGEARIGDDTLDRPAWYRDMVTVGKRAYRLAPDDPRVRHWLAISMGRLASTKGVLRSLVMANPIREHLEFVAEHPTFRYSSLNGARSLPCDALHTLGIFYRLVPDRALARVLTGTRQGLDQSVVYHLRANECSPGQMTFQKELAVTQLCIGQRRDDETFTIAGLQTLRSTRSIPVRDSVRKRDETDKRHIEQLLEDPSRACGYSRDGQQATE